MRSATCVTRMCPCPCVRRERCCSKCTPAASAEDFADAQPEQKQTASEEAPCACTETPCCSEQAAPEAPAETPEIKIEVVDGEDKAE